MIIWSWKDSLSTDKKDFKNFSLLQMRLQNTNFKGNCERRSMKNSKLNDMAYNEKPNWKSKHETFHCKTAIHTLYKF